MRVLHSKTLKFHDFYNHKDITYAILSHTWGSEEVMFQELDGLTIETTPNTVKKKSGYKKIQACCAQADNDGFEYCWIDTCCIDKRSSAELSEAINSMYRWYQDSIVCYAYLSDVPNGLDAETQMESFKTSRWFTRGWTLQELVAPRTLEFYGDQWHSQGQGASLGTKRSLQTQISEVANIPVWAVVDHIRLGRASVAQKMSWAARRETTRIEDQAYCLMGLFNVNMPLLYGEAGQAFVRLQEEIMKISDDESIFAWTSRPEDMPFQGLLAKSPAHFANSGQIIKAPLRYVVQPTMPCTVTQFGLHMKVYNPVSLRTKSPYKDNSLLKGYFDDDVHVALLNCQTVDMKKLTPNQAVGIYIIRVQKPGVRTGRIGTYVRINSDHFQRSFHGLYLVSLSALGLSDILKYGHRTSIFAKLTGDALNPSFRWLISNGETAPAPLQPLTISIITQPSNFLLIRASPDRDWKSKVEGGKTVFTSPCRPNSSVSGLCELFYVDAYGGDGFIVVVGMGLDGVGSVGLAPFDEPVSREQMQNLQSSTVVKDDCASLELISGRIVKARCRPQRIGQIIGCGLYVDVSERI